MENLNLDIGLRISQLRKLNKITQERLSENLDVSVKHISAVERGLSAHSLEKLIQVGEIFDCTLDYLILGKTFNHTASYLPASTIQILLLNLKMIL